eukprot:Skav227227  [mRNA]  locus=scaffold2048:541165:543590:- [translate_table: standard]
MVVKVRTMSENRYGSEITGELPEARRLRESARQILGYDPLEGPGVLGFYERLLETVERKRDSRLSIEGLGLMASLLRFPSMWIVLVASEQPFTLPTSFVGTWQGIPDASVIGPWTENFTFSISREGQDGQGGQDSQGEENYVFEANLPFDASDAFDRYWSWQRSYLRVSGEDRGRLLHCPGPRNPQLQRVAMMQGFRNGDQVTFCLRKWHGYVEAEHPFPFHTLDCYYSSTIEGCGCFNWTLSSDSQGHLDYQVSMAGTAGHARSKHMWVKLRRVPFTPPVHFKYPGTGSDFKCDYHSRDEHQTPLASCPFAQNYQIPSRQGYSASVASSFKYCYSLDLKTGLVLEWDLDLHNSMLKVQVSAWSALANYVSIGFRPLGGSSSIEAREAGTGREERFGMAGADIVLGHRDGIHQYYASSYSGRPEPDTSLPISKAFTEQKGDRLYLQFHRPFVGGRLTRYGINASIISNVSDMMWAVGTWDADAAAPRYHQAFRGWREVNWTDPEFDARPLLSLRPYKCRVSGDHVIYP